jgi:hypothetical protein
MWLSVTEYLQPARADLALWRRGPGEKVGLQVLRNSSIRVAEITAGDRDEFYR